MAEKTKKNPFLRDRFARMNDFLEKIAASKDHSLNKIVGEFGLKYGLRSQTVLAYVEQLQQAGKLKVNYSEDTVEIVE